MRHVPAEDVDLAIATVHFHDRSDEGDQVVADVPDVWALINREAVRQLHERCRRARFRRVYRARDVVDRSRLARQPSRFSIVHVDAARISELREVCLVLLEIREQRFRSDGDGDHLASFFRSANRVHPHSRARFGEHPHVGVDLLRVGKIVARARYVAQNCFRSRDGRRGRQIINERRQEKGLRGVFADFPGVFLVDRLIGIAPRSRNRGFRTRRAERLCGRD